MIDSIFKGAQKPILLPLRYPIQTTARYIIPIIIQFTLYTEEWQGIMKWAIVLLSNFLYMLLLHVHILLNA